MHISAEGKIGIWLGLTGLAGTGAVVVAPAPIITIIGWFLIAIAGFGAVALAYHHLCEWLNLHWERGSKPKMVALGGMVVCGIGFLGFTAAYFWSSQTERTTAAAIQPDTMQAPTPGSFESDLRRLTNNELRSRAMTFATQMRAFENDYTTKSRMMLSYRPVHKQTPEQTEERFNSMVNQMSAYREQERREFEMQFRPEALSYRSELLHRTGAPIDQRSSAVFESGLLAGINPIAEAADFLDGLARKLPN